MGVVEDFADISILEKYVYYVPLINSEVTSAQVTGTEEYEVIIKTTEWVEIYTKTKGPSSKKYNLTSVGIDQVCIRCSKENLDILEAKIFVDVVKEGNKALHLVANLVLATENMRIILHHLTHTHQTMKRSMRLISVTAPHFGHANRQVAI